jgi:dihydrodipicolinate synthase/N-acetylneuraminate lyase
MAAGAQGIRVSRLPGAVELNPIIATVTPLTASDRVDLDILGDYLDYLYRVGVRAILVNGTTGEFASLAVAERKSILERVREHWPATLIAHVGASALPDALALLDHAVGLADAAAAITPYFFAEPSADGVRRWFDKLLAATSIPLLLYNFPRHTQTVLPPELLAEFAQRYPMLAGVKDSGSDRDVWRAFAAAGLPVFVGDESAAARIGDLGVSGIVSGGGNPVPELPVRIAEALNSGDTAAAQHWQTIFDQWSAARHDSGLDGIAFSKAALAERIPGFPANMRAPLVEAEPDQAAEVRRHLRRKILPLIEEHPHP